MAPRESWAAMRFHPVCILFLGNAEDAHVCAAVPSSLHPFICPFIDLGN